MGKKLHYGILLLAVASVCVAGIDGAYIAVKDKIEVSKKEKELKSAARVLNLDDISKLKEKEVKYTENGVECTLSYYENEENHAVAVKGSSQGFGGKVEAIVGWSHDLNNILGVAIAAPNETPGFGDNVNQVLSENTWYNLLTGSMKNEEGKLPWFQEQFSQKSLSGIALKKNNGEIDGITGATITSNAAVEAVLNSHELAKNTLNK
ncbi:MAG: FMN-binding protein [Planctomycetota bacterium]